LLVFGSILLISVSKKRQEKLKQLFFGRGWIKCQLGFYSGHIKKNLPKRLELLDALVSSYLENAHKLPSLVTIGKLIQQLNLHLN
jgi:hypothetical protein